MRFRSAVGFTMTMQGVSIGLSSIFVLLSARWLGPEGRGVHAQIISAAQIAGVLLGLGLDGAIPFFVAGSPGRLTTVLRNVAWVFAGMAVMLTILSLTNRLFVLLPAVAGYEVEAASFAFWFQTLSVLTIATLASGSTKTFNAACVVSAGIPLVVLLVLEYVGGISVRGALWSQIIGFLAGIVVVFRALWRSIASAPHAEPVHWFAQIRIALLGFISKCFWLLLVRFDIFLVAALTNSLSATGVYSIGVLAAELFGKIPISASMLITTHVASNSKSAISSTITMFWINIFIVLTCFLPVILFPSIAQSILSMTLGIGYEEVYFCIVAMIPRVLFQAAGSVLAGGLAGRGYTWYHPGASFAGLISVILLDFMLIPTYGVIGAAAASGIGYFLLLVVLMIGFIRTMQVPLSDFSSQLVKLLRRGWVSPHFTEST